MTDWLITGLITVDGKPVLREVLISGKSPAVSLSLGKELLECLADEGTGHRGIWCQVMPLRQR